MFRDSHGTEPALTLETEIFERKTIHKHDNTAHGYSIQSYKKLEHKRSMPRVFNRPYIYITDMGMI